MMRYSKGYRIGTLHEADKPVLVCKLMPELSDEVRFENEAPTASKVVTWEEFYSPLKITHFYKETVFDLDHYISFNYTGSDRITATDCANLLAGNSKWVLAKAHVLGHNKVILHYFHMPEKFIADQKVEQLIFTISDAPYLNLFIARIAENMSIIEMSYEIEVLGQYGDAISAINTIKQLHCGRPIGTLDMSHITQTSVIDNSGDLVERKYFGLIGESGEDAKEYILSLETI